jgi:hypothetical protein
MAASAQDWSVGSFFAWVHTVVEVRANKAALCWVVVTDNVDSFVVLKPPYESGNIRHLRVRRISL